MVFKVSNKVYTYLIARPSIRTRSNPLIVWDSVVFVLRREVIPACNYDERQNCPTSRINGLDHSNPFLVTLLHCFRSCMSFGARNYHTSRDLAHHKASLIKVVDV
jgi:hypothetical protein